MKKNIIIAIVIIAVLICIGFFIYKTNNKNKTTKSNSTATTSVAKTNEIRHVSMDDIVKIMEENLTNTKKDTYQMLSIFQTKQSMKQFTTN